MRLRSALRWAGLRWAGVAAILPSVAACSQVLDPAGPVGAAQKTVLVNSVVVMLMIVVPTIVLTIAFAWWFRAGNARARYRPSFVYSGQVELLSWSLPVLVVLFLGGIAWIGTHRLDPGRPLASTVPPIEVQVVSLDWKWLFIYPGQGVATVNRLVIPAGVPVRFRITSASVMNAFFVPRLGSMIYAMNGMATTLNLQADRPGRFRGLSSHFSGDGFAGMRFTVEAVPPERFGAWAAGARGPMLDARNYALLARQSENVAPFTYGGVQPGLFDAVVRQAIPPAAGPTPADRKHAVSPQTGT